MSKIAAYWYLVGTLVTGIGMGLALSTGYALATWGILLVLFAILGEWNGDSNE